MAIPLEAAIFDRDSSEKVLPYIGLLTQFFFSSIEEKKKMVLRTLTFGYPPRGRVASLILASSVSCLQLSLLESLPTVANLFVLHSLMP
jgi:hypothetical protein